MKLTETTVREQTYHSIFLIPSQPVFALSTQYFSYIMATSFSGGGSRSSRRKLPTLGKQLVNFITCGRNHDDPLSCLMLINLHIHATRGTGDMWTYRCTKESSSGFCPKLMTIIQIQIPKRCVLYRMFSSPNIWFSAITSSHTFCLNYYIGTYNHRLINQLYFCI
jgi:hypothetical protein